MHEKRLLFPFFFLLFLTSNVIFLFDDTVKVYAVASSISINVADVMVNVTPGTFGHSDTSASNIGVRTTNGSGYTLSIRAGSSGANNNALINTNDNTKSIPSITVSAGISESTYSSDSSYNNTWAYKPSKLNSSANSNYLPAPNSNSVPVVLDQTSVSNPSTNNNYNVAIGAKVDYSVEPGTYSNTFVITAIANPIPYTITYNKNATDTVTNLPSVDAGTTYSENVTLSNLVPVRDGYDFKGWCTVQVADDAACSGTTYNPNGDGTNLSYAIDQTQASVSVTLYAIWETAGTLNSCNPSGTTIGTNNSTDIVCMQDFASLSSATKTTLINSMTTGTQYTLLDVRDDKPYTVSKLPDGKVWMTQNLDLDLDTGTTYTNADTDLGWNTSTNTYGTASWTPIRSTYATATNNIHAWCAGGTWNTSEGSCDSNDTPESYDPGDLYWNEATSSWGDWLQYEGSCSHSSSTPSCDESQNPLSTYTTISGTPTEQLHFGNYYNWAAAIASNDASGYDYNNTVANQSICPVGWTLPYSYYNPITGENLGDFADLLAEYGWPDNFSVPTLWASPLFYVSSGNYTGYLDRVGLTSYYWSHIAVNEYQAQVLFFYTDGAVDVAEYSNRSNGNVVRCVVR